MSPFPPPGLELVHKGRFSPSEVIHFGRVISRVVELPFFFWVPDEFPVTLSDGSRSGIAIIFLY